MAAESRIVTITGGTGFVGRHLTTRLTDAGWRVRIPTRHPQRHRDLGVAGGVEVVRGDVNDAGTLRAVVAGSDAVVNLVGILNERGHDGSGFRAAHVDLARGVVSACNEAGVPRLLHMSALNADAEKGPSHYLRTKGEGEAAVHAEAGPGLAVTSFRPSVVFGPGDSFFTRFAGLLRLAPGVFPLACAWARFAPLYVGDLVAAMHIALEEKATFGEGYDLCGPAAYTLDELVEYTAQVLGLRRRIWALPDGLARLQANVMEYVPGKPFSRDNYLSCQVDGICLAPFPAVFGLRPRSVEAEVPRYLTLASRRGHYERYRRTAGRA